MAAAVLGGLLLAAPAAAERQGYLVSVVGRVVSADRARATIVLHHAMLETADEADVRCTVPKASLRWLRAGMTITATADTRSHPWRLSRVKPFRTAPQPPVTESHGRGVTARASVIPATS